MKIKVPPNDIFGCLKEEIEIVGDVEAPVAPLDDWEALKECPSEDIPEKPRRARMPL